MAAALVFGAPQKRGSATGLFPFSRHALTAEPLSISPAPPAESQPEEEEQLVPVPAAAEPLRGPASRAGRPGVAEAAPTVRSQILPECRRATPDRRYRN